MIIYEVSRYAQRTEPYEYRYYLRREFCLDKPIGLSPFEFEIDIHDVSNVSKKQFKELSKIHANNKQSLLLSLIRHSEENKRADKYNKFVDSISQNFK